MKYEYSNNGRDLVAVVVYVFNKRIIL